LESFLTTGGSQAMTLGNSICPSDPVLDTWPLETSLSVRILYMLCFEGCLSVSAQGSSLQQTFQPTESFLVKSLAMTMIIL
jgi:hypothetical protein